MVGYDEEGQAVLVHDCDRAEVQVILYDDLQRAWDVNVPGLSKRNTLFTFEFAAQVADVATVVYQGLRKKAELMLAPPVSMFGIKGMRKLAREALRSSLTLSADARVVRGREEKRQLQAGPQSAPRPEAEVVYAALACTPAPADTRRRVAARASRPGPGTRRGRPSQQPLASGTGLPWVSARKPTQRSWW